MAGWGLVAVRVAAGSALGCLVVVRRCRLFSLGLAPGTLVQGWVVLAVRAFRGWRRRPVW